MPLSLLEFARAGDAARATASKLAKQKTLAALFSPLDDSDLRRAVRYMGGRTFAASDERVLGVSSRMVSEVILGALPMPPADYRAATIRHGEIGEALSELWNKYASASPSTRRAALPLPPEEEGRGEGEPRQSKRPLEADDRPLTPALSTEGEREPEQKPGASVGHALTLADLEVAFDALASTTQPATKKPVVAGLFQRCADPREACYLAKIILNDLRTGIKEGVLQAGVAQAFGVTLAEILKAQLLVGDLGETAVLAKGKALGTARFTPFHPLQFMLATPIESAAAAAGNWLAEDKLDGIRAQVHKQGNNIAIYTRTMDRTDESFPEVVSAVRTLPGDFVIDAEIVPMRAGRVLPFGLLQKRLGRKTLTDAQLKAAPCVLVAFDLLWADSVLMIDEPLTVRRAALEKLIGPPTEIAALDAPLVESPPPPGVGVKGISPPLFRAAVLLSGATEVTSAQAIELAFSSARDRGNEGLMLKDPATPYTPGRRGGAWVKLKTHLPTLDCVVTAAEYGHGKRHGTLSDYTFGVWETDDAARLVNIGKAFSGVTDEEIARLTELFKSIATSDDGRVFKVKPQVVLEIAFDQIQESGRHAGGYALRFPRVKRIRWDKSPADADRLGRVREVYESTHNFGKVNPIEPEREATLFDGM